MYLKSLSLFFIGLIFCSCEPPISNNCASEFDQLSLLENIGTNIIAPSYASFAQDATTLNTAAISFCNTPNTTTLVGVRSAFQTAWLQWQETAIFEFGPAETEQLRSFMNNFPVFVTRLDEAINSGLYDLNNESYSYTRGFPALDYLLYGTDTSTSAVLNLLSTDANSANRKQYLLDVCNLISSKATSVHDAWKTDGANYLFEFTSTDGIANGKPLSNLVNQLNKAYELIKNNKLGIPISAKTGYLPLLPQNVEAYYSRNSLNLAVAAVEACKKVFMGNASPGDSTGLDNYLKASGAQKGNEDLHLAILNQYDLALSSLANLQANSLHDAIQNDVENVKVAYAAAQNQMVQTKTDMPAALCISITYIDLVDDGD
jgi:predicted lipoprotein